MKTKINKSLLAPGVLLIALVHQPSGVHAGSHPPPPPVVTNTAVAAGEFHTLFLQSDGSLWGMGTNLHGQLGLPYPYPLSATAPTRILSNGVAAVAAGANHTLLRIGRDLWAMGYNQYGQLGDGTSIDHLVTEKIFSGSTSLSISAMAGGEYHSLFGTYSSISPATTGLRVMGANGLGELGDGTDIARNSPEQVENTTPISAVAAGYGHSLYLKSDTSISLSGTDVVLNAANGAPDENIYTLVGTNATQSLSQWDCVATNTLSAYGNFTITVTNAASPAAPQRYYTLLAQ